MKIILGIVLLLIVGGGATWSFLLKNNSSDEVAQPSPSPTFTAGPVPTASPSPFIPSSIIDQEFGPILSLRVPQNDQALSVLNQSIEDQSLIQGEFKTFRVIKPDEDSDDTVDVYTTSEFFSSLFINTPIDFINSVDSTFYISAFAKEDDTIGQGLIVRVKEPLTLDLALEEWQDRMPDDLKDWLKIDPNQAATMTFLDNSIRFSGISIKYINFPNHLKTIDYALVEVRPDETYFVIANSREHIFTIIEKLVKISGK